MPEPRAAGSSTTSVPSLTVVEPVQAFDAFVSRTAPPPIFTRLPEPETAAANAVDAAKELLNCRAAPACTATGPMRLPPERNSSAPPEIVVVPVNVLVAARASTPLPSFVSERPAPEIGPETRSVVGPEPLETFQDWLAPRVMGAASVEVPEPTSQGIAAVMPVLMPPTLSPWSVSVEPPLEPIENVGVALRMIRAMSSEVSSVAEVPPVEKKSGVVPPENGGALSPFQLPAVVTLVFAPPPSHVVPAWASVPAQPSVALRASAVR